MIRELVWIVFAGLVVFAQPAQATHEIRHNYEYCAGLAQYFYPEIQYAKALDVPKERYLTFAKKWMVDNRLRPELTEAAMKDVARMYDAADSGETLINKCFTDAALPGPKAI